MDGIIENGARKKGVRGSSVINYSKLVLFYQRTTSETADALEKLIEKMSESLPDEDMSEFRKCLYRAREHVAGYNGPITFVSQKEAARYVEEHTAAKDEFSSNTRMVISETCSEENHIVVLID